MSCTFFFIRDFSQVGIDQDLMIVKLLFKFNSLFLLYFFMTRLSNILVFVNHLTFFFRFLFCIVVMCTTLPSYNKSFFLIFVDTKTLFSFLYHFKSFTTSQTFLDLNNINWKYYRLWYGWNK